MASMIDFRFLDEGLGGSQKKRKRQPEQPQDDAQPSSMEVEYEDLNPPSSKRSALPSSENPDKPSYGKPTYDGTIAGKVSGRRWKQPRLERASASRVSRKTYSLEQRNMMKEVKKAYKERMGELKEEIRKNKVEKRKKREEREKRKKENILRSGTMMQKITNPKTLKKISQSKKERKKLRVVPDELLPKGK